MAFPFDSLPLLVKQKIIYHAADAASRPSGCQVLLAVSRSFRSLSIPHVFCAVAFRSIAQCAYHSINASLHATKRVRIPPTPVPSVSLAAYANATRHVWTILVDLGSPVDFFNSILELDKALACSSNAWTGVCFICFFDLKTTTSHQDIVAQLDARYPRSTQIAIVDNLAKTLYDHMPNLANMSFDFHQHLGYSHMIGSSLMRMLQSRLRIFRSASPIYFSPTHTDNNLTHVDFSYNSTVPYILARMSPEILLTMCIADLTPDFNWDCFARKQNEDLCFSSLTNLDLIFKPVDAERTPDSNVNNTIAMNTQPVRVLFPKLGMLAVKGQETQAPHLFENVQFSDCLYSIMFLDSLHPLLQLRDRISLSALVRVIISVNYTVSEDMFYQITNHYFGRPTAYIMAGLDITGLGFMVHPALLEWAALDTIYIRKIHLLPLVEIIEKSPSLKYLYVNILYLLQVMTQDGFYDWVGYLRNKPFQTLSAKLELLCIDSMISAVSRETISYFIEYLLARLPFLKELRVPRYKYDD